MFMDSWILRVSCKVNVKPLNSFLKYTPPISYSENLHYSSFMHISTSILEDNVDPDQLASLEAIWSSSMVIWKRGINTDSAGQVLTIITGECYNKVR